MLDSLPSQNLEAERAVLGSILVDAQQGIRHLGEVRQSVKAPEAFYSEANRTIFRAMVEVGDGLDVVTLADKLRQKGQFEAIGGPPYLFDCIHAVATAAHANHYARIVARCHVERRITEEATRLRQEPARSKATMTALEQERQELEAPQTGPAKSERKDASALLSRAMEWHGTLPDHALMEAAAIAPGLVKQAGDLMDRAEQAPTVATARAILQEWARIWAGLVGVPEPEL